MISLLYSRNGKIVGTVVDSETGDPLIGANIYLENTSLGSASDLEGRYIILNVPYGNHISFVGQSSYLLNLNLLYDNISTGTSSGLFYNYFSDRLFLTARHATPDVYERIWVIRF